MQGNRTAQVYLRQAMQDYARQQEHASQALQRSAANSASAAVAEGEMSTAQAFLDACSAVLDVLTDTCSGCAAHRCLLQFSETQEVQHEAKVACKISRTTNEVYIIEVVQT